MKRFRLKQLVGVFLGVVLFTLGLGIAGWQSANATTGRKFRLLSFDEFGIGREPWVILATTTSGKCETFTIGHIQKWGFLGITELDSH